MNNGNTNYNNKNNTNNVRAVSEFRKITVAMTIESLYEAYYDCRRNKRGTYSAARFEADHERELACLFDEVKAKIYKPGRSVAFIVNKPVKREIFAAGFRDRIIHHWIAQRIEPLLESIFITNSFNCRKGKGNSAGIKALHADIKECSQDYTHECWVMRLDLQGFFMSICRQLLCDKLCSFILSAYAGTDIETLLFLLRAVILNTPNEFCIIKGSPRDWNGLAPSKSLFSTMSGYGLPIGNLTSQITANFLLNDTDHYIRDILGIKVGRYVDDYYLVDTDKNKLLSAVPLIREHLKVTAGVTLHPRKFSLQSYAKGVEFIGTVVKRERIYISNRILSNAHKRIHKFNELANDPRFVEKNAEAFASCINSYLGIMKHYATYARRRELIEMISPAWYRVINVGGNYSKLIVKKRYKYRERVKYTLKKQRIK